MGSALTDFARTAHTHGHIHCKPNEG